MQQLAGPPVEKVGRKWLLDEGDIADLHIAGYFLEDGTAKRLLKSISARRALAAALGVSQPALDHWLAERRVPPLPHRVRLGRVLGALERQLREREDDR